MTAAHFVLSSWEFRSADQLIYNLSYDLVQQNKWTSRASLEAYEDLLSAAGSQRLHYSAPEAAPQADQPAHAANILVEMVNEFRKAGKACDIVFLLDDGSKHGASRQILAAGSEHFRDVVFGEYADSAGEVKITGVTSQTMEIILGMQSARHCLAPAYSSSQNIYT